MRLGLGLGLNNYKPQRENSGEVINYQTNLGAVYLLNNNLNDATVNGRNVSGTAVFNTSSFFKVEGTHALSGQTGNLGSATGVDVKIDGSVVRNGQGSEIRFRSPTPFFTTWDHLTGAWELWRLGVSIANGTLTPSNLVDLAATPIHLGVHTTSSLIGLDMVSIYTRKLSSTEIGVLSTVATCNPLLL